MSKTQISEGNFSNSVPCGISRGFNGAFKRVLLPLRCKQASCSRGDRREVPISTSADAAGLSTLFHVVSFFFRLYSHSVEFTCSTPFIESPCTVLRLIDRQQYYDQNLFVRLETESILLVHRVTSNISRSRNSIGCICISLLRVATIYYEFERQCKGRPVEV